MLLAALVSSHQRARRPPEDLSDANNELLQNRTNLFGKGDIAFLLRRIAWGQEVPDGKQEEEKFDGRPDRIILVTRFDISEKDGRSRHFLKLQRQLALKFNEPALSIMEIHHVNL